jgi:hypothetical protein
MYGKNKPDLRERGLRVTRYKKNSRSTCFYNHPYLIPAEVPQDNPRENIGIEKMVPK